MVQKKQIKKEEGSEPTKALVPFNRGEKLPALNKRHGRAEGEAPTALPVEGATRAPLLDPLQQYLNEVGQFPLLSREEEEEVVKHYLANHDRESAQKLVVSNLRLVVKIAMEYRRAFQNVLDLIQEGNMGLIRAVTKYDPTKGTRFSYYASWWIKAYILKYIVDNFKLVKIGTTQAQKKLFYNLSRERQKMESMGFTAGSQVLSEKLQVKEKEVVEMQQRMGGSDMSLDAPTSFGEGKINMDYFASSQPSAEAQVEEDEMKTIMFSHLDEFTTQLKEKEKKIFSERLYAEVPKTLQEIADDYGITRERIRQIEEKVIQKLKTFFKDKGFDVDLNK